MSCEKEEAYFVMGRTALLDCFAQSDLDMAGFHILNCPDIGGVNPQNYPPLPNQFLSGYNALTGVFLGRRPFLKDVEDWPSGVGQAGNFLVVVDGNDPPVYGWSPPSQNGLCPIGGTVGQVLEKRSNTDWDMQWVTPSGGGGGGATPAAVRAYSTIDQSIPNLSTVAISFNGTRFDLNGQWSSANPTRLTVNIGGIYSLFAAIDWQYNPPPPAGTRILQLRVNGNVNIATDSNNADATSGGDTYQTISTVAQFNAGDYVELLVTQSSGAAIPIVSSPNFSPEFCMVMEGGIPGPKGDAGAGVPIGGTAGQVLAKNSGTDFDTSWVNAGGGPGGGVTQVNTAAPLSGGPITSTGTIGMQNAQSGQFLGFTGSGTGAPSFQSLPVPANFQSPLLSPAGTANTTGVMMGLGTSVQFKPVKSGVVLVMVCGIGTNTVAGAAFQSFPTYGTGIAPSNGQAARGTGFGGGTIGTVPSANANVPFALSWIVKLTAGTNYWFDMALRATAGTARIADTSFTLVEL